MQGFVRRVTVGKMTMTSLEDLEKQVPTSEPALLSLITRATVNPAEAAEVHPRSCSQVDPDNWTKEQFIPRLVGAVGKTGTVLLAVD